MKRRTCGLWLAAGLPALALTSGPARAEDTRGRWSLGFSAGILSTKDDIRSNAAGLLLNERGLPDDDFADDVVVDSSIDPRQDDLLGRETAVQERQTYGLSLSYGLTSWLSLQMEVGYYKGSVDNLDTFRVGRSFVDINQDNVILTSEQVSTAPHDASLPISTGRLEQIPVSLSAVFRFRKDSPFNPILGAGVGMIFTDFEESSDFREMNRAILEGFQRTQIFNQGSSDFAENVQLITDRFGRQIASTDCTGPADAMNRPDAACSLGREQLEALLQDPNVPPEFHQILIESYQPLINEQAIPRRPFITTEVDDAFEYHLMGGAEYHFNERWSAFVLGRYQFTRANLRIRITDNGNLVTPTSAAGPSQAIHFDVDQAKFTFLSASNRQGLLGTGPGQQPSPVNDEIIVQGGEIDLSGFTLAFGVRFTF